MLLIEEIPNGVALRAPAVVRGPLWAGSQAPAPPGVADVGVTEGIRTPDLRDHNPALSPTELRPPCAHTERVVPCGRRPMLPVRPLRGPAC